MFPTITKELERQRRDRYAETLDIYSAQYDPREDGWRDSVPVCHFVMFAWPVSAPTEADPFRELLFKCPICGCIDIEDEQYNDYGGTYGGWTSCRNCEYTTSYHDHSAVI